jgi:uncharacterized protein
MANEPVFVDTWAHIALLRTEDQWHAQALATSRQLDADQRSFVVTEWVLTEFLGNAVQLSLRERAVLYVRKLCGSTRVDVVPATHQDWLRGVALFEARSDKEWSLVDCLSILACQDRAITDVFTGDRHFEQAGLRILLRPLT